MTSKPAPAQPFIYGRPVRPGEFHNREAELSSVFNRLIHDESTAIVGEPHIGKTSFLLKMADSATQRFYMSEKADRTTFTFINLHRIGNDYNPAQFWEEALEALFEKPGHAATAKRLQETRDAGFESRSIEKIFTHLGEQQKLVVLLLDEFERLLKHPNFQDPSFFALLRSVASLTGGLAIIPATRLSVATMNELGRGLLDTGSPFFNIMIEVKLDLFDESSLDTLLDQAGELLGPDDRRYIRRVAGRHPFLHQAMAASLVESSGENHPDKVAERFYGMISFHFDDLWATLDDRTRTTAVILSLVELGGRGLGESFAYGEIENAAAFGPELRNLEERGLAEQAGKGWQFDREHLLLWRGERWTVSAQAFCWWIRDVIIAQSRVVPGYEEWLRNKRYVVRDLLTQAQWEGLVNTVRKSPEWAVRGVGALGRSLFAELMSIRK